MKIHSVYSKAKAGQLLACTANALECTAGRVDVTPPEQYLQACVLPLGGEGKVRAHIHAPREVVPAPGEMMTQEGWIVLRGRIRVRLYDVDKVFLQELELAAGQLIVTFHGGHSMASAAQDTLVVEFKNGPYLGRDFTYFPE